VRGWYGLLLGVLVSWSAPAFADEARPWAAGVGEDDQKQALRWFEEGNALFTESQYAAALVRYREALRVWKHPAIHYNAGVSLINLEQPLAAYEQIEAALAYGEAPLGAENRRQAELYRKLLAGQLAELEVHADEPGAEVLLDGKRLFVAPGSARMRLMPGAHQLVERKPGFSTETRALDLPAGRLSRSELTLSRPKAPKLRSVRRWATWQPWTVLGSGALLGLAGVPVFLQARKDFETYDDEIARVCPAGCPSDELPRSVVDTRKRARAENTVAVGLFATGGALAATGVVLVILNQPRLEPEPEPRVAVTPLLDRTTVGAQTSLRF
jgi:hypothetical protein